MTRQEYAAYLRSKATTKYGTNQAILNHAIKVEAMADADFPAHMAKLNAETAAAAPAIARMAAELSRQMRRGR